MHKVILFGLDGASFNLIQPWVKDGSLPTFARLLKEGAHGVLKSTHPPVTVPAWAAMLTGKNPGRLGYHHFSERKEGSYHFGSVNLRWDEIDPVWKVANDHSKQVCIFNVPTTPIPRYFLNGIFVAGSGPLEIGLGSRYAIPERINKLLEALRYREAMSMPSNLSTPQILGKLQKSAELQCQLATQLLTEETWDLFIFCIFVTDLAEHLCLKYGDKEDNSSELLKIYQTADRWLGEVLNHIPEDCNLMIVSDHGQTASRGIVDLNTWLMENGFLVTKPSRRRWISRSDIYRFLSRWDMYPFYKRLSSIKSLSCIDETLKKKIPWEKNLLQETDWSRTQAYSISSAGIFINLAGREPKGIVGTGEYGQLREKIISSLRNLRSPETGEKIVLRALRREEVYQGEFLEKMPDIVVEWEDGYSNLVSEGIPRRQMISKSEQRFHGGVHTRDGIFIAWGPDIAKGKELDRMWIVSVAPTLLYLLGLPIPSDLDGRVLTEILSNPPEEIPYSPAGNNKKSPQMWKYSPEEDKAILKRLRDLGYAD